MYIWFLRELPWEKLERILELEGYPKSHIKLAFSLIEIGDGTLYQVSDEKINIKRIGVLGYGSRGELMRLKFQNYGYDFRYRFEDQISEGDERFYKNFVNGVFVAEKSNHVTLDGFIKYLPIDRFEMFCKVF